MKDEGELVLRSEHASQSSKDEQYRAARVSKRGHKQDGPTTDEACIRGPAVSLTEIKSESSGSRSSRNDMVYCGLRLVVVCRPPQAD